MTTLTAFLDTYWWLIPLVMMGLCFLGMRTTGLCGRRQEAGLISGSALDVLDRRFATGEIDKLEYQEKLLVLGHGYRG